MSWDDDDNVYKMSGMRTAIVDEECEVPDSWDIESEEEAPKSEPKKTQKTKPKLSKIEQKNLEKAQLEKEIQQKLQEYNPKSKKEAEELDKAMCEQMFSDFIDIKPKTIVSGIDDLEVTNKDEFEVLRDKLKKKILPFEKIAGYNSFIENVYRDLAINLDVETLKKLSQTFNIMANEKTKAQKTTKKKKNNKGKIAKDRGETMKDYDDDDVEVDEDDFYAI